MNRKRIAMIGVGGVGGYVSYNLLGADTKSRLHEITIVARGETLQALRENGLVLLSGRESLPPMAVENLVSEISQLHGPDLIILSVKEYDLNAICHQLKSIVGDETIILPLMNGVDIYERIRTVIANGIVLPACVYVASHMKAKGVIEHNGSPGKIIAGNDPIRPGSEVGWVIDFLRDAGIDVTHKQNAGSDIWTKFIFIASFGLVTARYNKSIGQVHEDPGLRARAGAIMQEITRLADSLDVRLEANIIELSFRKAASFPYATPTSLQLDVQSGRENNELDLFAGTIIKFGTKLAVPVPETKLIFDEITAALLVRK